MQEHPIPQDVTGYKFHIVGNMTLKQFAEVGAGVLLAVIVYNTNLLPLFKWPLILFAVGLGGMMAFVPIEERPLDHWIVTFFRRLYSPTKFYWRKESEVPFALKPEKQQKEPAQQQFEIDLTPARQQRIKEYIASVQQPADVEPWESQEASRVADILQSFDDVMVEKVKAKPQAVKPQLHTRVRNLSASQTPPAKKRVVFRSVVQNDQPSPAVDQPTQPVEETLEQTPYAAPTTAATTNARLPFPQKELVPNALMGMVLTRDNKLVDRAVVSIKNPQGGIIRALNTNLLGQFFATDPLANGTYVLSVEKSGLTFPERTITLNGSLVSPLELRAT